MKSFNFKAVTIWQKYIYSGTTCTHISYITRAVNKKAYFHDNDEFTVTNLTTMNNIDISRWQLLKESSVISHAVYYCTLHRSTGNMHEGCLDALVKHICTILCWVEAFDGLTLRKTWIVHAVH